MPSIIEPYPIIELGITLFLIFSGMGIMFHGIKLIHVEKNYDKTVRRKVVQHNYGG